MNQENTQSSSQANTACSRCGGLFACEVTAGQADCWCMQESEARVLPVPAAGSDVSCLCPACLRSAHAQRAGVFTPF